MRLLEASRQKPAQLIEMLNDLGEGENGFGGTSVATGGITLDDYLQRCVDRSQIEHVPQGLVPQTIFWILDDQDITVGMLRMRHYLNENLLDQGGHIGFYIRPQERGKGYAKSALKQALDILYTKDQEQALLTVDVENNASIAVITNCGGVLEDTRRRAETGGKYHRYWIDLGGVK